LALAALCYGGWEPDLIFPFELVTNHR